MIFPLSATSQSIDIEIFDDTGLPVTGLVAATFPTLTYSLAGANADVAFPALSDLATITTAYSSGGVKERGNGVYRLDLPNGIFTTAGQVRIRGEATGKHVVCPWLEIAPSVASVIGAVGSVTGAVGSVTGNVGGNVVGSVASVTGNIGGNVTGSVGSVTGAVGSVTGNLGGSVVGDVQGKLLGGGASVLAGTGVRAVDGSGNAIAPAATALSTAQWTNARAGYLDNLNVGGAVASHADIVAINQSASKHLLLVTVGQYEPGETYTVEMRTFAAADGSAVNADSTPTLTATGQVSGSLSANLSIASNPATGVYRWTYTPGATPTLEQIRFDGSATISAATFTLSCYSQTIDEATAVFTATDQSHLTSIFNKLPTNAIADETVLAAAIAACQQAGAAVTLPGIPANWITAAGIAAGALNGKGDWLLAANYTTPPTTAQIATAVLTDTTAGDLATVGSIGHIIATQLGGALVNSVFTAAALANAPSGNTTVAGYAAGQDPATLVLEALAANHNNPNTIGARINSAGSGADPLLNPASGYLSDSIGYEMHWLFQRANADEKIDTTSSPGWNIVYYVQGTTAELLRQRLLDLSGNPIKLATTIVAQTVK